MKALKDRIVITGHYGSGKTNLAINLAIDLKKERERVVLADLDVVNPYFRTADYQELAQQHGVELIAPNYAGSNLDIPSLTGELDAQLGQDATVIIDVGGDDAGAYALGRYAPRLMEAPYDMLYVINRFRYLTREPREAVQLMQEIEAVSRLRTTALVNNSNLSYQTSLDDIAGSESFALNTAKLAERPLLFTTMKTDLYHQWQETAQVKGCYYPVHIYVTLPWS